MKFRDLSKDITFSKEAKQLALKNEVPVALDDEDRDEWLVRRPTNGRATLEDDPVMDDGSDLDSKFINISAPILVDILEDSPSGASIDEWGGNDEDAGSRPAAVGPSKAVKKVADIDWDYTADGV